MLRNIYIEKQYTEWLINSYYDKELSKKNLYDIIDILILGDPKNFRVATTCLLKESIYNLDEETFDIAINKAINRRKIKMHKKLYPYGECDTTEYDKCEIQYISFYIYYLSCCEPLFKQKKGENATSELHKFIHTTINEQNVKTLKDYIVLNHEHIYGLEQLLVKFYYEYHRWELIGDKNSTENVLTDSIDQYTLFYLYTFLCDDNIEIIGNMLKKISIDMLPSLIIYMTNQGEIKDEHKDKYNDFCKLFKEESVESNYQLFELLNNYLKMGMLEKAISSREKLKENSAEYNEMINSHKQLIFEKIKENPIYKEETDTNNYISKNIEVFVRLDFIVEYLKESMYANSTIDLMKKGIFYSNKQCFVNLKINQVCTNNNQLIQDEIKTLMGKNIKINSIYNCRSVMKEKILNKSFNIEIGKINNEFGIVNENLEFNTGEPSIVYLDKLIYEPYINLPEDFFEVDYYLKEEDIIKTIESKHQYNDKYYYDEYGFEVECTKKEIEEYVKIYYCKVTYTCNISKSEKECGLRIIK